MNQQIIKELPTRNVYYITDRPQDNKQKRDDRDDRLFFVRLVRLELTRANAHYPLKVACLPFHHNRRKVDLRSPLFYFGIAKIH